MTQQRERYRRDRLGYGSSYRRGGEDRPAEPNEISAVLGGQRWLVRPDRKAPSGNPCLWMQAGVVRFKDCSNFYDCTSCKYDLGMRTQVEKGRQISWQEAMRRRPDLDRVCRHSLTGRIAARACAYDYECAHCDFDQYFEDILTPKTESRPQEVRQVKGFDVPMDRYFHNGHTWARIESGGYVRIGLDDFALKLLGAPDAFSLPLMGKELDRNAAGWGLRRREDLADVLSPVNGVIVEVNAKVRENPPLAAAEPFGAGWLFMVRTPDIRKTGDALMSGSDCLDWMNAEVGALEHMIEEVAGPLAADGGYLKHDIYGNLPDLGWKNLTARFLGT